MLTQLSSNRTTTTHLHAIIPDLLIGHQPMFTRMRPIMSKCMLFFQKKRSKWAHTHHHEDDDRKEDRKWNENVNKLHDNSSNKWWAAHFYAVITIVSVPPYSMNALCSIRQSFVHRLRCAWGHWTKSNQSSNNGNSRASRSEQNWILQVNLGFGFSYRFPLCQSS